MPGLRLIKRSKPESLGPIRRARAQVAAGARRIRRAAVRVAGALTNPVAQILYAAALALFGAWLIAMWVVGLVVILFALFVGVDALLREGRPAKKPETRHDEIIERWRNAR